MPRQLSPEEVEELRQQGRLPPRDKASGLGPTVPTADAPKEKLKLKDSAVLVGKGVAGIVRSLPGQGLESFGRTIGSPGVESVGRKIEQFGIRGEELADRHLSPAARGQQSFGQEVLTSSAQSIPGLALNVAAAGLGGLGTGAATLLATKNPIAAARAGWVGGRGAGAGAEGLLAATQSASEIGEQIRARPAAELFKSGAFRKHFLDAANLPPAERTKAAIDAHIREAESFVLRKTLASTAGFNLALGGLPFARKGKNLLGTVARGMRDEAIQEAPQSFYENKVLNEAIQKFIDPSHSLDEGNLRAAAVGAASGALLGGGGAALGGNVMGRIPAEEGEDRSQWLERRAGKGRKFTATTEQERNRAIRDLNAIRSKGNKVTLSDKGSTVATAGLERFASLVGRKVIRYRGKKTENGLVLPGRNDIVFIHEDSDNPYLSTFFHEMKHQMDRTPGLEPELRAMRQAMHDVVGEERINKQVKRQLKAAKQTGRKLTRDQALEEVEADLMGEAANTEEFWAGLKVSSPTAYQRIINYIMKIVQRLNGTVPDRYKITGELQPAEVTQLWATMQSLTTAELNRVAAEREAAEVATPPGPQPTPAQVLGERLGVPKPSSTPPPPTPPTPLPGPPPTPLPGPQPTPAQLLGDRLGPLPTPPKGPNLRDALGRRTQEITKRAEQLELALVEVEKQIGDAEVVVEGVKEKTGNILMPRSQPNVAQNLARRLGVLGPPQTEPQTEEVDDGQKTPTVVTKGQKDILKEQKEETSEEEVETPDVQADLTPVSELTTEDRRLVAMLAQDTDLSPDEANEMLAGMTTPQRRLAVAHLPEKLKPRTPDANINILSPERIQSDRIRRLYTEFVFRGSLARELSRMGLEGRSEVDTVADTKIYLKALELSEMGTAQLAKTSDDQVNAQFRLIAKNVGRDAKRADKTQKRAHTTGAVALPDYDTPEMGVGPKGPPAEVTEVDVETMMEQAEASIAKQFPKDTSEKRKERLEAFRVMVNAGPGNISSDLEAHVGQTHPDASTAEIKRIVARLRAQTTRTIDLIEPDMRALYPDEGVKYSTRLNQDALDRPESAAAAAAAAAIERLDESDVTKAQMPIMLAAGISDSNSDPVRRAAKSTRLVDWLLGNDGAGGELLRSITKRVMVGNLTKEEGATIIGNHFVEVAKHEDPSLTEEDILFSSRLTPAEDATYMAAVESGDEGTQQRLVDKAAKKAENVIKASHGGRKGINVFDTVGQSDFGTHFTERRVIAELFSQREEGEVTDAYLRLANPLRVHDLIRWNKETIGKELVRLGHYKSMQGYGSAISSAVRKLEKREESEGSRTVEGRTVIKLRGWGKGRPTIREAIRSVLEGLGYDSLVYLNRRELVTDEGTIPASAWADAILADRKKDVLSDAEFKANNPLASETYVPLRPEQIKSADPITRDDSGEVIPPSQRFNPTEDDIRFSSRLTPAEVTDESSQFFGKPPGQSVTFTFVRNTESSPDMGERFGQHLEPAGRYMQETSRPASQTRLETGEVTFRNPLYIEFGGGYQSKSNWKPVLSERYGGSTGEELSRKIVADGHDGIVTVDGPRGNTSEIVDLTSPTTRFSVTPAEDDIRFSSRLTPKLNPLKRSGWWVNERGTLKPVEVQGSSHRTGVADFLTKKAERMLGLERGEGMMLMEAQRKALLEKGYDQGALDLLSNPGDDVEYAIRTLGWIRISDGNKIELKNLSKLNLQRAAKAMRDLWGDSADAQRFDVERVEPRRELYTDIPWAALADGSPSAIVREIAKHKSPRRTLRDTEVRYSARLGAAVTRPQPGSLDHSERSIFRTAVRLFQDKFTDVQQRQKNILTSQSLTHEADIDNARILYPGQQGYDINEFRKGRFKNLVDVFRTQNSRGVRGSGSEITIKHLTDYLVAKHAITRNRIIRGRDPTNDRGSGITDQEARHTLRAFRDNGMESRLEEIATAIYDIGEFTRQTLVDADLITAETKTAWERIYGPHYVTLKDLDGSSPPIGRGFDIRGAESLMALGRGDATEDVVGNMLAAAETAIHRAHKVKVSRAFLEQVRQAPDSSFWNIVKTVKVRSLDSTGHVKVVDSETALRNRDDIVTTKELNRRTGEVEEVFVQVHDKLYARAMKNLSADQTHALIRRTQKYTRFYSNLLTSWNPTFMIPNFFRDIQTATATLTAEGRGDIARHLWKPGTIPRAAAGMARAIRGDYSTPGARLAQQYMQDGGSIEHYNAASATSVIEDLNKQLTGGGPGVVTAIKGLGGLLTGVNKVVENSVRLAVYEGALNKGVSRPHAAAMAKGITVDFDMKGELSPTLNTLFIFFNAAVQGNVRMIKALSRGQNGTSVIMGLVVLGFLNDFVSRMFSGGDDDEDGIDDYDEIEEWVKDRNMVFMGPKEEGVPRAWTQIPLPYGYNTIYSVGRNLSATLLGGKDKVEAAANVANSMTSVINPLGGGTELFTSGTARINALMPTFADPFVQSWLNRDWLDRPIVPERRFPDDSPPPKAYTASRGAPEHAKNISAWLNTFKGNETEAGPINISPDTIAHWEEFIGGGSGKFVSNLYGLVKDWTLGETAIQQGVPGGIDETLTKTPILRRFRGQERVGRDRWRYFEASNAIKKAHNKLADYRKAKDFEGARRFKTENGSLISLKARFDRESKILRRLQKQYDVTKDSAEKRKLEERMAVIYRRNLKLFTQKGGKA